MRRSLLLVSVLLGLQLLLAALVFARGFPYFGSSLIASAPLWELPVAAFHLPGIEALRAAGLCCGFRNGLVLGHTVVGGHLPMRLVGTALLAGANWLCWTAVLLAGMWARTLWRARQPRAAGAGPGPGAA